MHRCTRCTRVHTRCSRTSALAGAGATAPAGLRLGARWHFAEWTDATSTSCVPSVSTSAKNSTVPSVSRSSGGSDGCTWCNGCIGATAAPVHPHPAPVAPVALGRHVFGLRRPASGTLHRPYTYVDFFRRAQRLEQRNLNRPRKRSAPVAAVADGKDRVVALRRGSSKFTVPGVSIFSTTTRAHLPVGGGRAASAASGRFPCASASASPARSSSNPARSSRPRPSRARASADESALAGTAVSCSARRLPWQPRSCFGPLLFALCSWLFFRLGRLLYRRSTPRACRTSGSRPAWAAVPCAHTLDPAQIGGAGAVGVDRRHGELKDDVVFDPLRDNFAHRTRQIDDGRKRRTFLSARDDARTPEVPGVWRV